MNVSRRVTAVFHTASRYCAKPIACQLTPSLRPPFAPSLTRLPRTASVSGTCKLSPLLSLTGHSYTTDHADLVAELVAIDKEIESETYIDMPSTVSSGSKRKRTDSAFFAVRRGRTPGIYASWPDCQEQIGGFSGAECTYVPTSDALWAVLTSLQTRNSARGLKPKHTSADAQLPPPLQLQQPAYPDHHPKPAVASFTAFKRAITQASTRNGLRCSTK